MPILRICRELDRKSWQVWPNPEPIPPGAVREGATFTFILEACEHALNTDLLIDDVPLEALRSRQANTALWRWAPGFHAGIVEAQLRIPHIGCRRFEIVTDPDVRKLTREDFDVMVREVLEDTLALFSISAFRKGFARQRSNRQPPLARLEYLRSRGELILQTIEIIARSPRNFLGSEEVTVPLHKAKRVTGPEIIRSFRLGTIRTETGAISRLPQALNRRLPGQVRTRKHLNSVDLPEHRQIKACLISWAVWLNAMADTLAKVGRGGDIDRSDTAIEWSIRTRRIARQMHNAAHSRFMKEVGEGPANLQLTSLFRNDPNYGRFYRLWQDINLGLAALFGDFLQMPLARTYELYELWCFLRLLRASINEYEPSQVDLTKLFLKDADGGVTIASGAISVAIGSSKLLCFQRKYNEYWTEESGEGSYSRAMVPDIVLYDIDGSKSKLFVLDSKYRIGSGLNDAMTSIHTYREALVRGVSDDQVERVVAGSYLLTPQIADLRTDFLDTPVPDRFFHPSYREKFQFGVVTLRPGMTSEQLRASLRTIVRCVTKPLSDG